MRDSLKDQRAHRRLTIQLPVGCVSQDAGWARAIRGATLDISTGGIYFEADVPPSIFRLPTDAILDIELTIPPGDGHFPYEGHLQSIAQVVRWKELGEVNSAGSGRRRVGVAARFREPLRLAF